MKFRSAPDDFCEEAIVLRSPKEEVKRQMWRKGDRKPPFFLTPKDAMRAVPSPARSN